MAGQLTITISGARRALTAQGRIIAGESLAVSVAGMAGAAATLRLALVSPTRQILAACGDFDVDGTAATGTMATNTAELKAYLASVPTGRAVSVACLVWPDVGGYEAYCAGAVDVVAEPMPDELAPIPPVAEYVTEAQMEAAIAVAVSPLETAIAQKLDKSAVVAPTVLAPAGAAAEAAATGEALAGKLTASDLGNLSADITTGGTVSAGAMTIQGVDVATEGMLRYELIYGILEEGALHAGDRAVTQYSTSASATALDVVFPAIPSGGQARDFVVAIYVENSAGLTVTATEDAGGEPVNIYSDDADVLKLAEGLNILAFTEFATGDFVASKRFVVEVVQ